MHGMSIAFRSAGRPAFLLPENRFGRIPDQRFQARSSCLQNGTGRSRRPFAPQQRLPLPGPPFLDQRSSACRFTIPPAGSAARSALLLPVRQPVRPDSRPAQCFRPVAALPGRLMRLLFQPPLPIGTLGSLRIKAFNWSCRRSARLPNSPDLPSLPTARLFLRSAADHRSRSATFSEACCSSNLLEPPSLCPGTRFPSTPM